jgi:serine/threonine-protein kinase
VAARAIEIKTPTPGFAAQVYASTNINLSLPFGDSTSLAARGWQGPVGSSASVHNGERVTLNTGGRRFRYYLIWLSTLPPGMQRASISDVTLLR